MGEVVVHAPDLLRPVLVLENVQVALAVFFLTHRQAVLMRNTGRHTTGHHQTAFMMIHTIGLGVATNAIHSIRVL